MASTLMTWLLEITPTAIPSLSHTTTRGVSRFARIWAASKSDASRLSTASRFRAASKMCLTRIISIVPHLSSVGGSPPRSSAAEREASLAFPAMPSLASLLTLTYSLRFYSPVLPPADSLAVSGTAQSPVPSAQLLARIPCPGCADAAQKGGTEDLDHWHNKHQDSNLDAHNLRCQQKDDHAGNTHERSNDANDKLWRPIHTHRPCGPSRCVRLRLSWRRRVGTVGD